MYYIKQMKRLILVACALMMFGFSAMALAPTASAQFKKEACEGLKSVDPDVRCNESAPDPINKLLALFINIFSVVVGVIAVISIIIGGLKFITSHGDPANLNAARNTIIYAVVGLVIVALAQIIVRYVLMRATKSTS